MWLRKQKKLRPLLYMRLSIIVTYVEVAVLHKGHAKYAVEMYVENMYDTMTI